MLAQTNSSGWYHWGFIITELFSCFCFRLGFTSEKVSKNEPKIMETKCILNLKATAVLLHLWLCAYGVHCKTDSCGQTWDACFVLYDMIKFTCVGCSRGRGFQSFLSGLFIPSSVLGDIRRCGLVNPTLWWFCTWVTHRSSFPRLLPLSALLNYCQ